MSSRDARLLQLLEHLRVLALAVAHHRCQQHPALLGAGRVRGRATIVLGTEIDSVRKELTTLTDRLPAPDIDADVRLWVDRSFTVRGAGTVVTGTLAAGTIRVGDDLVHNGRRVTVRGVQSLGRDRSEVAAVARGQGARVITRQTG